MLYGVPIEEFWDGDYTRLKFYVQAHKLAVEQRNQELWLQGLYFYDGVSTALHNAFLPRGKTPKKYIEKPYRITEMSEVDKQIEKEEILNKFKSQLNALGRNLGKRQQAKEQGGVINIDS